MQIKWIRQYTKPFLALHYTSVQTNTNFYSLAEVVLSSLTVCLLSLENLLLMYVTVSVSVGVLQIHLRRLDSWLGSGHVRLA